MTSLQIRRATGDDESSLSRICLLTADAGKSAEGLHDFKELPGLVYSVPYVKLPTTWAFVLEEVDTKEVVGYVVGSTDTRAYERYASEHWWPALSAKYLVENATKPGDVHYSKLLCAMQTALDATVAFSPAHLHINLLDKHQRRGWGRRLIGAAVEHLKGEGLGAVWIGLDPRNDEARKFYTKVGFKEIVGADSSHLGLRFADFEGNSTAEAGTRG
jgi:ribosomal protein S18 acetylase RimI-like enzyme